MRILCAIVLLAGCEQVPEPAPPPPSPIAVTVAPPPAAAMPVPLPVPTIVEPPAAVVVPAPVAPPAPHPRPRPLRIPPEDELPTPPSMDADAYRAWLHDLTALQRAQIDAFCRADPAGFHATCGGIGPLHIPPPPSLVAPHPTMTIGAWRDTLSKTQLAYVDRMCDRNDQKYSYSQLCGGTPLVLSFDDLPVAFTADGGRFAFYGETTAATDWPTAATPWLALDLDDNGAIDGGAELFGDGTRLASGDAAADGFAALARYDANHDGVIDRADPIFASLLVWTDRDGDRKSSPAELAPLADRIDAISLAVRIEPRCDARHNCERERASISVHGARVGSVVDVHLHWR